MYKQNAATIYFCIKMIWEQPHQLDNHAVSAAVIDDCLVCVDGDTGLSTQRVEACSWCPGYSEVAPVPIEITNEGFDTVTVCL